MKKVIVILVAIAVLMFCEYRFIMTNLSPYYAEDGSLCIEIFGQVDTYCVEVME